MLEDEIVDVLRAVYADASTIKTKNGKYTTVNQLTDQHPALTWDVLNAAVEGLIRAGGLGISFGWKLLGEDDKGAILTAVVADRLRLPIAMARKYPYKIPGTLTVQVSMEYDDFYTTVCGVEHGDNIVIVDDTLATGGTVAKLIEAVTSLGAQVYEVWVVTEKIGYGGRQRIEEYGVPVKAVIGIEVDDDGVIHLREAFGKRL